MSSPESNFQKIEALANALSESIGDLGFDVTDEADETKKVATAVDWSIDEDSDETRLAKGNEFLSDLRERIVENYGADAQVVAGSFNVFNDPVIHRSAKFGVYGWVEVVV